MRVPHRVPWASLAELDEVCRWIYEVDSDEENKRRALNRLSAWQTMTPLPASLSATVSILSAIHLDKPAIPALAVRHSYAMSLTRLVNSLVDPLQRGAYARSIAAIASQLGLPAWWVELRHAATHEDLPSIQVLREAAREALGWLYHNYFLPTLTHSAPVMLPVTHAPLGPTLKSYKSLSKVITRDSSLEGRNKIEMERILREVERWLGEVRVALSGGWDAAGETDADATEGAVMEVLCEALLERGGLVPVSKKKRSNLAQPVLQPELPLLWQRLLLHLHTQHAVFASTLFSIILQRLQAPTEDSAEQDETFDACLVGWAVWVVDQWAVNLGGREEVVKQVCIALGECDDSCKASLRALANELSSRVSTLQTRTEVLVSVVSTAAVGAWDDEDIGVMQKRLDQLRAAVKHYQPLPSEAPIELEASNVDSPARGWKMLREGRWHERPIGWIETS